MKIKRRQWLFIGWAAAIGAIALYGVSKRRGRHRRIRVSQGEAGNVYVASAALEQMIGHWLEEWPGVALLQVRIRALEGLPVVTLQLKADAPADLVTVQALIHQKISQWLGMKLPMSCIKLEAIDTRKD